MNKNSGYDEILKFIAKHGIEDKDSKPSNNTNFKHSHKRRNQNDKILDLHGKRESEAEQIIRQAFINCKRDGIKKLHIIHGKGINSDPNDGPVLKNLVKALLINEFSNIVRQFYSAPKNRGGSGVTIVEFK